MTSGYEFKRIRHRRQRLTPAGRAKDQTLLELLSRSLLRRFARMNGGSIVAIPLEFSAPEATEDPPPNPCHPACAEHAESDYCRESWQLHRAELRHHPATHWHKCEHGRLCALVPIVHNGQCIAAIKLACADATRERDFERQAARLDILAKGFVIAEAEALSRLAPPQPMADELAPSGALFLAKPVEQRSSNPQVLRAIQYIQENLADPKLTIGRVARELGLHPTYLGHLFAEQVGAGMCRFIAGRRVERAKALLATTQRQIKCIARDVGYANPNWFSYVFRAITGLAPGAYRRQARGQSHADSGP